MSRLRFFCILIPKGTMPRPNSVWFLFLCSLSFVFKGKINQTSNSIFSFNHLPIVLPSIEASNYSTIHPFKLTIHPSFHTSRHLSIIHSLTHSSIHPSKCRQECRPPFSTKRTHTTGSHVTAPRDGPSADRTWEHTLQNVKKCAGHLDRQVLPFAGPNANLPVLACFFYSLY